jgi:hypothetical protein
MTFVLTPNDASDCVRVFVKQAQEFAILQIPNSNVATARQEPSLVRMPCYMSAYK